MNDMTSNTKPKRIVAKIEKEQKKLETLKAKREEIEKKYQAEFDKIDAEIKEQEKIINSYREKERQAKLAKLSSIIGKKGVDIDTLLNAVETNNLYEVQEMLENAEKVNKSEPSVSDDNSPADDATDNASSEASASSSVQLEE